VSIAELFTDAVGMLTKRPTLTSSRDDDAPDVSAAPPDTRRLIRNRQYCTVIAKHAQMPFDDLSISCARKTLEREMALVPGGEVCLVHDVAVSTHNGLEIVSRPCEPIAVDPVYFDRACVTNADYAKFVKAGGYENSHFWPEGVLANVLQFVDSTGNPGPKYWSGGQPPRELVDHPVVGISWYEASAYATWAGKRLPTSEEWQRAGTWPKSGGGSSSELRYPWGNAFDPFKANTWACGTLRTFPVDGFSDGNTPNGIRQLIGNVWEWIDAEFQPLAQEGVSVNLDESMAEIRGGAFDTYFHSQSTCQFRTGQPLLFRSANVGFRCCVSESALAETNEPNTELDDFNEEDQ
jgi:iron(II)-dependent oxidoreductase